MAPPQWAYQVENFVNEPDEELVCSICRAVFCDPALCPCDHVFCRVCISKWLQNNRNCPICRKRVSNSSIKLTVPIIKNLIMKLKLNCRNKSLGCKSQFSIESSESHVKECEYELVQCRNKPCKDKLFRKDINEHETSDCPYSYKKCKICGSKMPTSEEPEQHNCIRALQLRLRRKNNVIRKKNSRIKELKDEIKNLKASSQGSGRFRGTSTSPVYAPSTSTASSISPGQIRINIHEYDSPTSYLTSDSDISTDSIFIFTNQPLENSDDNAESDSFTEYMDNQENVEYPQSGAAQDTSEYRNAESQTVIDGSLLINAQQSDAHQIRSGNSAFENDSTIVEVPHSVFGENEESTQPRRPIKRRPTTEKPAKRRLPPLSPSSEDDDDQSKPLSSRLSKRCWRSPSTAESQVTGADQSSSGNKYLEAGTSSVSEPVAGSSASANAAASGGVNASSKWNFRSKTKLEQKRAKHAPGNAGSSSILSRVGVPSGNAVFERTLALLEQYNLESDPEWLPEYASHRGNDTTTESDSSYDLIESSNSELSDFDENNSSGVQDRYDNDMPSFPGFIHW